MDDNRFDKLLEQLLKNKKWPLTYMFKFIVPNHDNKVNEVVALLPKEGKLSFNHTKNLKYVSITCVANMQSAEEIITITRNAGSVEGVMIL